MKILILCFALSGFAAHAATDLAKVTADVASIKTVLPAGDEIAGAYVSTFDNVSKIELRTGDDYLNSVSQNYLIADLNKDGKPDLAVAVETAPTSDKDGPSFGKRKLLIYLSDATGKLVLFTEGAAVLNADDGGIFGDPLEGLSQTKTGALLVSHYAGSADRWALNESFGFINGNFYKIGETDTAYNDITLKGETVDTNLITGNQVTTHMLGGNKKDKVTRQRVKVKPLQKLSEVSAEYDLEHSPAQD